MKGGGTPGVETVLKMTTQHRRSADTTAPRRAAADATPAIGKRGPSRRAAALCGGTRRCGGRRARGAVFGAAAAIHTAGDWWECGAGAADPAQVRRVWCSRGAASVASAARLWRGWREVERR